MSAKKKYAYIILGILFGLNILALSVVWNLNYEGPEVTFFDVGHGDSYFIQGT